MPGNNIDDDGNGFIDDIYGYDFVMYDGDPSDAHSHGTHCAGTIAGRGNNGVGVAGVNWQCKIMACRFLDANGNGYTSDAIEAINYAVANGAKILSNSWGGGGYSATLEAAIENARDNGVLFVAAAGNAASDNDSVPHYPSSYETSNVLAIANTNDDDLLSGSSSYGLLSVDMGAPGSSILSTIPPMQTIFYEDFQSASIPGFTGTQMTMVGASNRWGTVQNDIGFGGDIAATADWANSSPYSGGSNGYIMTPPIDTRGMRGVILEFNYRYEIGSTDLLSVDIWDGDAWNTVFTRNNVSNYQDYYWIIGIEIPDSYLNENMQVGFRWETNFDDNSYFGAEIDNINIMCIGGDYTSAYGLKSGTSMATPHVSGVAALLLANYPGISLQDIKARLMLGGDSIPALDGITLSGRRLNAYGSLTASDGLFIVAPNGGEVWNGGLTYPIVWSSIGGGSTVDIFLLKGGSVHTQLADDYPNVGEFAWTIPESLPLDSDYRISIDDGLFVAQSDADFTIRESFDYFTELFDGSGNPFDLSNKSLLLSPVPGDDYSACVKDITSLPSNPAGGIVLNLFDDDYELVSLSGQQVYLYGSAYSEFYVGSNGYITFTVGDTDFTEGLSDHFGFRRISALFDDLNPSAGGRVSWKQLADRVAVTWLNVPEFGMSTSNTFQVELFFDGSISISWLDVAATDGLAGLSNGQGLPGDFSASDISEYGPCVEVVPPRPPRVVDASDGLFAGRIRVRWSPVPNGERYRVYRAESLSDPRTPLGRWRSRRFLNDVSAEQGKSYYYWVRARNFAGVSRLSRPDEGWLAAPPASDKNTIAAD